MEICVVTDIHGLPNPVDCFSAKLPRSHTIVRFALNDLCLRPELSGEDLHRHLFENGGIEVAITTLRKEMTHTCIGLGYSAGGTLLWRAANEGMSFAGLYCISSTRLRYENPISARNHVFFGGNDENRPSAKWLESVPERQTVYATEKHSYYLDPNSEASRETCEIILTDVQEVGREQRKYT